MLKGLLIITTNQLVRSDADGVEVLQTRLGLVAQASLSAEHVQQGKM